MKMIPNMGIMISETACLSDGFIKEGQSRVTSRFIRRPVPVTQVSQIPPRLGRFRDSNGLHV
jgi:hypothetical protein